MKKILNILRGVWESYKNDPVKHCGLFRERGCSHVDGPICNFPDCEEYKSWKYRNTPKEKGNFICPNCGVGLLDYDPYTGYEVKGKEYPVIFNRRKGFNGWTDTDDWTEVHCCNNCKTEFISQNGI